ncbi:MAG TPA: MFS transporter [Candidatus Angelobacter sp.]|nr:MFS transporter [Candidatus Angelobacter sp.]
MSTEAEINGGVASAPLLEEAVAEPPRVEAESPAHSAATANGPTANATTTNADPSYSAATGVPLNQAAANADAVEAPVEADATSVIEIPRLARALRHRDFRLFWTGNFLSNIGTWMQNIAQGWLVLKLTNSAFWLGVVGFSSSIPILFFALIGGVIADHVNKRKLLMITQSAMMIFAFTLAALTWLHHIDVYTIVLLALGTGIAMSLNTPGYQALVPRLLPREDLTNGIALNSAQFNMSRVIGPTLGGFAMALVGEAGNFFLNGLSFLAVLVALTRINYHEPPSESEGDLLWAPRADGNGAPRTNGIWAARIGGIRTPRAGHFWQKIKEGFTYVRAHAAMSSLILVVAIGSLLAIPYLTFVPYFARDVLGTGEPGLGMLMACSGAGAFLGAITIASLTRIRRRGRFVVRFAALFYLSIIAFTFSRNFYLSGFFLALAGYCMIISVATINSLLQHLAADHMRGRVMSIYSTAFLGLPPIGCLIAGSLARVIMAPHAIAGMTAVALLGCLGVYWKRAGLRELD